MCACTCGRACFVVWTSFGCDFFFFLLGGLKSFLILLFAKNSLSFSLLVGIVYLPEIKYRRILNRAFGPGGWAMMPRGEPSHFMVSEPADSVGRRCWVFLLKLAVHESKIHVYELAKCVIFL